MEQRIAKAKAYCGQADDVAERLIKPETQHVLTRAVAGHREMAEYLDIMVEPADAPTKQSSG